jgi:hypothetical protein
MLAVLALAAAALSACSPAPAPDPEPTTAFASEEEAFAAAEEVYRAYNDALNSVDLSNPETFEAPLAFSSGDFLAADRKSFSELHAEKYELRGATRVISFRGTDAQAPYEKVVALICVDVSDSDVVDSAGTSVISAERSDVNAVSVTFRLNASTLLIDHADRQEVSKCEAS